MDSGYMIDGVQWVCVTCFADDHPRTCTVSIPFRLTKSGRVNLHDVNKYLRSSSYKVPLRFLVGGIRRCNPDVGWPEDVLVDNIPEIYASSPEGFLQILEMRLTKPFSHEW